MHELSVALEVVERAVERANGARVCRITLAVGVLSCVLPDALEFCFDLAAAGTPAEGAKLEVRQPRARVVCNGCDRHFELDRPFGACTCGCADLQWCSGRELALVEMEIEDRTTEFDNPLEVE